MPRVACVYVRHPERDRLSTVVLVIQLSFRLLCRRVFDCVPLTLLGDMTLKHAFQSSGSVGSPFAECFLSLTWKNCFVDISAGTGHQNSTF